MSTLVPKKTRDDTYRFFFTEGVLCCPKNRLTKWHGKLGGKSFDVPVIQVMQLMRNLRSRGFLKEQFAWRHYYWFLNDKGVDFMRKYLHLAENVVPNTQRKPDKDENFERRPARPEGGDREGRGRGRGGRGGGRGGDRDGGGRGGFGRGRGGFRDGDGGAPRDGGRGRGRGGFRTDRREYHADPNAQTGGDNTNNAPAGDNNAPTATEVPRPRGRGRASA